MNKKSIRRVIYIVSSLIFLSGLFVTADYFSLFGSKVDVKLDFVEVRFRTVNADTGGLIMHVGVRCFQKNNNNACTRRESHRVGVVSVHMPLRRVIQKTLLFEKPGEIIKTTDPKINFMLLHQNYHNPIKTLLMDELYSNKVSHYVIEMKPKDWAEAEAEASDE